MLRLLWIFIAKLMLLTLVFSMVLQNALPWPWFVAFGFVGAFLVIHANVSFGEVAAIARDIRCIQDVDSTTAALNDERFAAVGHLMPMGKPLHAPFSRRECVYYRYTAGTSDGDNNSSHKPGPGEYSGLALTQCSVRSPTREIRLIGVPILKGFDEESRTLNWDEHYDNAEAYVKSTSFETVSMGELIGKVHSIKETFEDEDGQVRRDMRLDIAGPIRDMALREVVVPSGVEVCAVGTWSAKHAGLIQRLGTKEMLTLYEGGPEVAVSSLKESRRAYIRSSVIALVLAAGLLVWGAMTL